MAKFETRQHVTEAKGLVEYVSIGVGVDTVHRPATDADRQEFGPAYAAFKSGVALEVPTDPVVPPVFFEKRVNPKGVEVDYVSIAVGKDRVHRQATEEDKATYAKVYAAFAGPAPVAAVAHADSPAVEETVKSEVPSLIARTLKSLGAVDSEDKTPVDNPKKKKK